MQQDCAVEADELAINTALPKEDSTGGIEQEALLHIALIHQARPKIVKLSGGQHPLPI